MCAVWALVCACDCSVFEALKETTALLIVSPWVIIAARSGSTFRRSIGHSAAHDHLQIEKHSDLGQSEHYSNDNLWIESRDGVERFSTSSPVTFG